MAKQINLKVVKILWGAFLFSKFIFLFVGLKFLAPPEKAIIFPPRIPIKDSDISILLILGGSGVVALIMAQVPPKVIAKSKAKSMLDPNTGKTVISIEKLFPSFIIRMAMFDSVAIFGLILIVLLNDGSWMLPFFGASVLGMLLNFPSESFFASLVKD